MIGASAVRSSLKLDLRYYAGTDKVLLQDTAAKQVLLNPMLVVKAVRKLDQRALDLPDQRRILLKSDWADFLVQWQELRSQQAGLLVPALNAVCDHQA